MHSIKKYYEILFGTVFFFLLCGSAEVFACQCFNSGFLRTVFINDPYTHCYIYKEGNIVYRIEIFDKLNGASSNQTGCELETDFEDIYVQYSSLYFNAHNRCIREIMDACNGLHINIILRDY